MRQATTPLAWVLVSLLLGATAVLGQGGQAPASRPLRMLFLHRTFEMDPAYLQELQAAGISVTQRGLTDAIALSEFESYHVVVIPDFVTLDAAFQVGAVDVPTWWDVTLPNLRRYVERGGGLLIATFFNEAGEALSASINRMIGPWGAEVRALQIIDPAHIASIPPTLTECPEKPGRSVADRTFYCFTERIARHPATAGVRRIYYPICNMRWDDCYATPPLVLYDRAWTPLVRTMADSGVYDTKTDKSYQWLEAMGTDDVIAAARPLGKGRVALLSVNSYYTFFRPYTQEASLGENHHGAIDGLLLHKGDGSVPSDVGALLLNLYRWLAEPATKAGFGRVAAAGQPPAPLAQPTVQQVVDWDTLQMPPTWRHRPIPVHVGDQVYYDEQPDVTIEGELQYFRALIGVHSAFSDGTGTVREFAEAAKKAGYALVAFTERFEDLSGPARWEQLRRECAQSTTDTLVCLPGIDIADPEGGRYLIFGQPNYPAKPWLSPDGKYLIANNAMSLGFTTHLAAIARPQHSAHQYRLFKHFQGLAVATYRDAELADDGLEAYAWQVSNGSNPIPLAVHDVFSPQEVPQAAQTGLQQMMPADTVPHAADYFRCALAHFFDCPARYFLSEGPIIDTWTVFNKDVGEPREHRDRYRIALGAHSDVPLREVVLYAEGRPQRRWLPNATSFQEHVDGYHAWQHHWYMVVTDAKGRRAISPHLRTVPKRYIVRCGDRQNWLGYVSMYYTGTPLRDIDLFLPVEETREGDGTFRPTAERGTFLAPMLEFPLTSNRFCEDDVLLGQRYPNVENYEEVCYDATPMRVTVPARLYDGKIRVLSFAPRANTPDSLDGYLYHLELRLKMDATRAGEGDVWPWFATVSGQYRVRTEDGWQTGGIKDDTVFDLHPGDIVGEFVALSPNLRLGDRRFGLTAPPTKTVRAGDTFAASFFQCNRMLGANQYNQLQPFDVAGRMPELARAMGFDGPTPYALSLTRGRLDTVGHVATFAADNGGVAGSVRGAPIPYDLPVVVSGVNPHWTAGVWRSDDPVNAADQCVVDGHSAYSTLDVTRDVAFYVGNFVSADDPSLVLNVETWSPESIEVEVHNPSDAAIASTVQTPSEIKGLKPLKQTVTVPAGTTVRLRG